MDNSQNLLSKLINPIGISSSTGIDIYDSFTALSGFNYIIGMREVKDLLIVEKVAEGTACTLLCGILIFHKDTKELLVDIPVERNVHYSREKVLKLVHSTILKFLSRNNEVAGVEEQIDIESASKFLLEALDNCYFEKSRKLILTWAESVGLLK